MMCCYLNVQFQDQNVKGNKFYGWTALTLFITVCSKTLNGKATFSVFNVFQHNT